MDKMKDFLIEDGKLVKYNGSETVVVVPEIVWEISNEAFMNCKSLREIILPETLEEISDCAFLGCKNL